MYMTLSSVLIFSRKLSYWFFFCSASELLKDILIVSRELYNEKYLEIILE